MLALTTNRQDATVLPLWNAVFCLDCEVISNSRSGECPVCGGRSLVSLPRILGGSLFAHRAHLQCESGLFDITIAVELQQICSKELTTTLERLTSVIGPKLARDRAIFQIHVEPTVERLDLQDSLCFPEREAA
jgi:hypothetical protein